MYFDIAAKSSFLWVGASSNDAIGNWTWINGEPLNQDLFPWGKSEPDPSVDQSYMCIKVTGGALFHNCLNTSRVYSVCQLDSEPVLGQNMTFRGLSQPEEEDDTL